MQNIYVRGTVAVLVGMLLNFLGDWMLGVRIEIFVGMATFTFPWMIDVFIVPLIVGWVVAKIYGKGHLGKYIATLPPLLVRCLSYLHLYYTSPEGGDFFYMLHLHYWGPTVILVMEAAYIGGVFGGIKAGTYQKKGATES